MNAVLVDTSLASRLLSEKIDQKTREQYYRHMEHKTLALSFQSVAELWEWPEANDWGENRRQVLGNFIEGFLIIGYDYGLARIWAKVRATSKKQGRRLEAGDAWVVATAVFRNIPLLTHDQDMVGLEIRNLEVVSYVGDEG